MGRIKTMKVKSLTRNIIEKYEDQMATDFKGNKDALKKVADIPSKKLRNVVAGYATRLMKNKEEI